MSGRTTPGPAVPRGRPGLVASLVERLRGGGAHVVTGEPGGGRSTLLAQVADVFDAGPAVVVPAPPERPGRPPAGLRALCRAAGVAADRVDGPVRELVGALRATAAPGTVLLCADDADLWDSASRAALGRLAARLPAGGGVALVLTVAGHRPVAPEFAGLPLLRLDPLSTPDATALLDAAAPGTLDPRVRDELAAAAEGNPGLLLRLSQRLTPAQLAGVAPLPRPLADAETLTALAGRHLTELPARDRDTLLVTAAAVRAAGEPTVGADVVRRAAAELAGDVAHPGPTEAARDAEGGAACPDAPTVARPARDLTYGPGGGPTATARLARDVAHPTALPQPPTGDGRTVCRRDPGPYGSGDGRPPAGDTGLPDPLHASEGRVGFRSTLLRRTVYAAAPAERRRAAHAALARALPDGRGLPALLHRSWAAPAPSLAADLTAAAADPATADPPELRCTAHTRAAELAPDAAERARSYTAAAEQALLAGQSARALRLLDTGRCRSAPAAVRARAELLRGTVLRWDGPVDDARETLLLAAALSAPHDPELSARAALAAADAAWSAGDLAACHRALAPGRRCQGAHRVGTAPGANFAGQPPRIPAQSARRRTLAWGTGVDAALRDHRTGMQAVLQGRFDRAGAPLRRVVDRAWTADDPEELLRAASAALLLGDTAAARRAGARALAVARTDRSAGYEARALEYLAYGELRAGRHALARAHAEEGLRSAYRTGQRNTAAHHHAVLALAASIAGEAHTVAEHVTAAMATARRHGLAQAAALAQWATARAELGHGRPREAAERLGPLVRPGPGRGHFAVWLLAVPCYVEACALARQPEGAGAAVEDFARWTACGADPQAPAQLLRCRALLAPPEAADPLYRQALWRHAAATGDFERARTELLYGKWLRRRRRLREARTHLRAALLGFERCGAGPWAQQAAAELRANGVTGTGAVPGPDGPDGRRGPSGPGGAVGGGGVPPDRLGRLTPQQLRIARRVAQGLTNREVALSLSVSTRTVDYHLRNVFAALGVRSRMELARLVQQAGGGFGPA
ncbi:helix-turn-helix transcriptional regulator [Streptomyces sp. NPDC018347]|uniref:helix-turn-helix transcriptional regulator n=1 Tax=Streptomyces sp. NPDC018347 TaxID=3157193 RepID=UPI0033DDBC27